MQDDGWTGWDLVQLDWARRAPAEWPGWRHVRALAVLILLAAQLARH
jgi:hypothetical protein